MDAFEYIKIGQDLLKFPTAANALKALKYFELALQKAKVPLKPKVLILISDAKHLLGEEKAAYDLLVKAKESMDAAVQSSIIQSDNLRDLLGEDDINKRIAIFEKVYRNQILFTYQQILDLKKQGLLMRKNGPIGTFDVDTFICSKIIVITDGSDYILYPFAIPPENVNYITFFILQENEEPFENSLLIERLEKDFSSNKNAFIIEDFNEPIKIGSDRWYTEINNFASYQLPIINAHFTADKIVKFKMQGLSYQDIYKKTKQ